jgi:hypothetical protein
VSNAKRHARTPDAGTAARSRRPRLAFALLAAVAAAVLLLAPSAQADFGVKNFDVTFTNEDGTMATQAGSHPFAMTTSFGLNYDEGTLQPEGRLRDFLAEQAPGFLADTTAYPRCTAADFLNTNGGLSACPLDTQVGVAAVSATQPTSWTSSPIYNLTPPPGVLLRLGFTITEAHIVVDGGLSDKPPYNPLAASRNTSQLLEVFATKVQLWGNPSDSAHDSLRGVCGIREFTEPPGTGTDFEIEGSSGPCPGASPNPKPLITAPDSCAEPLATNYEAISWDGALDSGFALTHDAGGNPQPFTGCGKLGFNPSTTAVPTTKAATSPTGLDFSLDVADEGLTSVEGLSQSEMRKAVVTLPAGMSVNPSQAEGLAVCTEAELEDETLAAEPGQGCPQASKIGTISVESPLVSEAIGGSLYVAKPYENLADDSLIAVYLVFKSPKLGIIVKQPLRVESNPLTGQLTTVAEEVPQLPFSHFRLHFREGTRSPLVSPPACGTYDGHDAAHEPVRATLYPWSGGAPAQTSSTFQIISGPDNGPCPSAGLPPFHPDLVAGTTNNAAGKFSPFNVRLSRTDSEQEFTNFSIKLPPGIAGKLAGIPYCSDAAIAQATARTGPHGGQEELDSPSCPAASQVGRTLAGAGVGPSLAYAPGKIYLAGPYHGSPISFVSITSGVVGPFDIGTVVVRLAIRVNPETGEVFLDSTGSDPIPHIVKGIPVHLRDIRAYTDRPEFTFNPTNCTRTSTASTVLGSGLNFASEADDNPITVTSPFQAADCAALPFEPKLSLRLIGGTKRGDFPKLKAFLRMRGFGEAGVARAQVTLPRSEFIAQAHFNTICTRVQFKQAGGNGEACPAGSIYGWARAKTPVLSDPLEGPVYLRSSEHQLPDVVASLRGQEINVHLVGHVDSVKGRLRNTFETVPDAPVEWASFSFQGQKKGLFENSTDLCATKHFATVKFSGQNGKRSNYSSALKVKCGKGKRKKAKRHSPSSR